MTMNIYTRTGDRGDTGLFGGGRVPKDDPRVEAYGDVDELNAALGLARAIELMPRVDEVLVPVQRDLFAIGALLATPDRDKMHEQLAKARVDAERVAQLEAAIDAGEAEGGVELVDVAVGLDAGVVLGDAPAAEEARVAAVARAGIDVQGHGRGKVAAGRVGTHRPPPYVTPP